MDADYFAMIPRIYYEFTATVKIFLNPKLHHFQRRIKLICLDDLSGAMDKMHRVLNKEELEQ